MSVHLLRDGGMAPRVVVAGAGIAGLTAAHRLTQSGLNVTVLEAQDRVGGRLWSVRLDNGAVAELGGEWIEGWQRHVRALADEFGIEMSPVGIDFAHRDLIGSLPIPLSEHRRVADAVSDAASSLTAADRSEQSAADLLALADDGSVAFAVLRQRLEGSAGAPLRRVASSEIDGDFGIGESTYLRLDDGNDALARAAADAVGDVRTGQPVHRVENSADGVIVATPTEVFQASAVVIAVPLPVIGRIEFSPPLPPAVIDALTTVRMGTAAKIVAPTKSPPPLFARQNGSATWWCWTGKGTDGAMREVVTGFAGTPAAIEAVSVDWREQIVSELPNVDVSEETFVDWGVKEWIGGCYTALGPGDEDRLHAFATEGRTTFAGEHTLGAGSIDGAIQSGELAAERVRRFLARR
jgi:monoamine oxidase